MPSAQVDQKECPKCGLFLSAEAFGKDRNRIGGLDYRCKTCRAGESRSRYHSDLEASRARGRVHQRKHRLMKQYGLTLEAWDKLLEEQQGACAICKALPDVPGRLHVDHDHVTGAVRGLLCNNCNVVLGMANDDVEKLAEAIRYLHKYKSISV